jgi:hypothetical protein
MAGRPRKATFGKLLRRKEELARTRPDLEQAFDDFMKNLTRYHESRESSGWKPQSNDYVIFGASFRKPE